MKTKAFDCISSFESADLILIPVPWSPTVSYKGGTEKGPELIRQASHQLDFFKPLFSCSYNQKIHFLPQEPYIETLNRQAQEWVRQLRKNQFQKESKDSALFKKLNQSSQKLRDWIYETALQVLNKGKIPALVGGEHSISEGLLALIGERNQGDYGILHLDAHADLRDSYEGFERSHASVMNNVLKLKPAPKKLIQVAVRDFCEEEQKIIQSDKKIECYLDEWLCEQQFQGKTWASLCKTILSKLPKQIYISLDVDVLSWEYAPGTGTPVPGGLSFNQVLYLLSEVKRQNKKLLAFDVVESSPGETDNEFSEWNGNVSARLIYHLSGLALNSFNKL